MSAGCGHIPLWPLTNAFSVTRSEFLIPFDPPSYAAAGAPAPASPLKNVLIFVLF